MLPPCSGYCSTTLAGLSKTAVAEYRSTRRHSNLQPYRTFNFDVLGGYILKGMVILCTKHTPRQALLIKSKISHSGFHERTVRDTFGIVIMTGHPVCGMDPPMAGGCLQLACVNIVGAGKSVHEGNLLDKCNTVPGEQNRLVH